MNYNPCLTIDVSQSRSHIQGFTHFDSENQKPANITQAKTMLHTKNRYKLILDLIDIIYSKTNIIFYITLLHLFALLKLVKMILEALKLINVTV